MDDTGKQTKEGSNSKQAEAVLHGKSPAKESDISGEDQNKDIGNNGFDNIPGGITRSEEIEETSREKRDTGSNAKEDTTSCGCCSKLNTTLITYKAFYFFFLAAIGSLFPYLAVFYKQIWLSARQTGILMGVTPLINLFATPMWGAVTDTYKATRFIFILSLIAWLATNYSISLVSPVFHVGLCRDNATVTLAENVLDDLEESMALHRLNKSRHISHFPSENKTKREVIYGHTPVKGFSENGTNRPPKVDFTKGKTEVKSNKNVFLNSSITDVLQILRGTTEENEDENEKIKVIPSIISVDDATINNVVKPHSKLSKEKKISILAQIKKQITSRKVGRKELVKEILTVVESTSNSSIESDKVSQIFKRELAERIFDFLNMEGHYPWPLDTVINYQQTQTSDEWEPDKSSNLFTILLVITVAGTLVSSPAFTLADTNTLRKLGDNREEYGRQRMWGALGWGLGAFTVGASLSYLQELRGCNNPLSVDYMPCFYAYAVLMGITILIGGLFEFEDHSKQGDTTLWQGLKTLCDYQYLYFILTMMFCGSAQGFLQTFLFWHLQDLGGTQFLFSAITAVQCASEILMYSVSGFLIRHCGYQNVLYLGLLCYAIRLISYATITNCWLVLPLEVLHGVSLSAVWSAAVVFVGLIPGANHTMQGILAGVHWGLGFGGGGILGGVLVSWLGSSWTFIVFGSLSVTDLVLFALVNNVETICRRNKNSNEAEYSRLSGEVVLWTPDKEREVLREDKYKRQIQKVRKCVRERGEGLLQE